MWNLERYKENIAIYLESGETVSYQKIAERQKEIGSVLRNRTVAVIVCKNTLGCILCYLSFMRKGIVPLLLPSNLREQEALQIVQVYRAGYLCCDREYYAQNGKPLIVVEDFHIYAIPNQEKVEMSKELAVLLTTSGSTGDSRCVRLSEINVKSNASSICHYLGLTAKERAITSLPFHYTYGLSVIHSHLLCGAALLLTDKNVLQKEFWQFAEREGATSFAGVPFTYEMMDWFRLLEKLPKSIRTLTQAGGKLEPELQKKIAKLAIDRNIHFYIMYGQTEATARISYLHPSLALDKIGCVGKTIPGGKIWISEQNEVCYQGPNVCLGYAQSYLDLIKEDENNGILYTGDLGYIKDGLLYLEGRKNREVKINGRRIHLEHVEANWKKYFHNNMICSFHDKKLYLMVEGKFSQDSVKKLREWIPILEKDIIVQEVERLPRKANGKVDIAVNP
ncbi:MAG: AMP-binding protein [Eubacterium sp.]|nr:AMP-binding protein [Eubacterium sp.]